MDNYVVKKVLLDKRGQHLIFWASDEGLPVRYKKSKNEVQDFDWNLHHDGTRIFSKNTDTNEDNIYFAVSSGRWRRAPVVVGMCVKVNVAVSIQASSGWGQRALVGSNGSPYQIQTRMGIRVNNRCIEYRQAGWVYKGEHSPYRIQTGWVYKGQRSPYQIQTSDGIGKKAQCAKVYY
jgi:hypothetical protein